MLKFSITQDKVVKDVQVPTSWNDVTWEMFIRLAKEDDGTVESRIAVLLDLDRELIDLIPADDVIKLIPVIHFIYDTTAIQSEEIPEGYEGWYIGHESWSKLEKAKQEIAKYKEENIIEAGREVVKIYTGEDIVDKPITEVLPLVNFFLANCINFMTALKN